jgi:hypothetical protein
MTQMGWGTARASPSLRDVVQHAVRGRLDVSCRVGIDGAALTRRVVVRVGAREVFAVLEAEQPDEGMPVDPWAEDSETESTSQWSDVLAPLGDPGVELAVLDLVDAELPLHAASERTVAVWRYTDASMDGGD